MPLRAAEIARLMEEIGLLMEFRGDNPFKIRAYRNAARTLGSLEEPLDVLLAEGRLRELPGIGAAIAQKIEAWAQTGSVALHDRLRAETPVGVLEMLAVPGLGPKRARTAFEALGLASLDDLEAAATSGRLAEVPGFGERSVASVLAGLARVRRYAGRYLAPEARAQAEILAAGLSAVPGVTEVAVAGSLRRRLETVHDADLVAASPDPAAAIEAFVGHPMIAEVARRGDAGASVVLAGGMPADLRVVAPAAFAFALLHLTGSAEHNVRLRGLAKRKGLRLSEYGLIPEGSDESLACADEAAVYAALGLAWIPPELREDRGEVEAAAEGRLPVPLEVEDLAGAVHCHTDWSDGRASLEAMAAGAAERGFSYLVVCDHSRTAAYAGGLSVEDLARQREEIDRLNAEGGPVTILAGSEVDILPDGSLDYPDETLASLDLVVASLHSQLRLPAAEQTERVVRALANPWVDVLGHPTGRLLLSRDGAELDMERVLDAAAEHGVALEVNANPRRLDLDWRWHGAAVERGIRLSIDPDAHGPETIAFVAEGVAIARKGWVEKEHVLNALPVEAFRAALRRSRS